MAKKITKRVNYTFSYRHFKIRIISYSFFEFTLGQDGDINIEVTHLKDNFTGKTTVNTGYRFGWNWYANKPNIDVMTDVIKKFLENAG